MVGKANGIKFKLSVLFVAVALIVTGCFGENNKDVDAQEANSLMEKENYVMIDVRTPEEFAEGHVPGSINIPVGEIEERLDELDRDKSYLMMCRVGVRSERARDILVENGFGNVYNIKGGIIEWPYELEQ
ncbi:rhodanese-like domain-containing protein [Desulfuribacillus alkaliarsenatis]|uniref:Rhodanese domain-containing protein n=1 Tax=Desulfuribacillus alkaliarsenatis TaxID=766136 RepID=A0A1E5G2Y8_9FIRM|nr:rhodanese-like domain-containing protein [Desulfuribacillus alkaliarsenatis]OEF96962.1 hypothetical protein BHF68_04985 [Desulfuribacillus alkaliarsenatis]